MLSKMIRHARKQETNIQNYKKNQLKTSDTDDRISRQVHQNRCWLYMCFTYFKKLEKILNMIVETHKVF